ASDDELSRRGFPRRPRGNAELLRRWETFFAEKVEYIEAKVEHSGGGSRHDDGRYPSLSASPYVRNNWCGVGITTPGNESLSGVTGQWTVPEVDSPGKKPDGQTYYCASWVGMGGLEFSSYMLQAGVQSAVKRTGKKQVTSSAYAWFEWVFP